MTEKQARAGGALPLTQDPGAEVKSAMSGFLQEFSAFRGEVKQTFQQQDDRMTMLDRKTMTYARPNLSASTELDLSHKKALGGKGLAGKGPVGEGATGTVDRIGHVNTLVSTRHPGFCRGAQVKDSCRPPLLDEMSNT